MAVYTNKTIQASSFDVYMVVGSSSFELIGRWWGNGNLTYADPYGRDGKDSGKWTGFRAIWEGTSSTYLTTYPQLSTFSMTIQSNDIHFKQAEIYVGTTFIFEDRCKVPDSCDSARLTIIPGVIEDPYTFSLGYSYLLKNSYCLNFVKSTSKWIYSTTYQAISPPDPSGAPDVNFTKNGEYAVLSYSNVDPTAQFVYFDVLWKNLIDNIIKKQSGTYKATVSYGFASIEVPINNHGASVAFRARNANELKMQGNEVKTFYSDYSDTTEWYKTVPQDKSIYTFDLTTVREDEVAVAWSCGSTISGYDGVLLQYAQSTAELEAESGSTFHEESYDIETEPGSTHQVRVSGLETGTIWYFRIRAYVSDSNNTKYGHWWYVWGTSHEWDAKSVALGTVPDIPTTWCLINSFGYGSGNDGFPVYAIHNCKDGSACSWFQIEMTAYDNSGAIIGTSKTKTIENKKDQYGEYSKDNLEYEIRPFEEWATGSLSSGTVRWRIRTKGVVDQYGPWSVLRNVRVYVKPTLSLSASTSTYPIAISATMSSNNQEVTSFYFELTALSSYKYTDGLGETTYVTSGQILYTAMLPPKNVSGHSGNKYTEFTISPIEVHLEPYENYSLSCVAYTDAGLAITTQPVYFTHSEFSSTYYPDVGVFYSDPEDRSFYIQPICYDDPDGEILSNPSNLIISLYRYNADSTYTLISENANASAFNIVHDPHPRLDTQIYKVVVVDKTNGNICSSSKPLVLNSFKQKGLVLQWDDQYGSMYSEEAGSFLERYIGKFLFLPFNVDVSESITVDKTLVSYIGREDPVSYYGTAKGKSYTIKTEIPKHNTTKFDSSTALSLLRELSRYTGNVYVRTFSGIGCWATVDIDFNIDHCALTIPINFKVTPVEGGV